MGLFTTKEVKEIEVDGVKVRIGKLTGDDEDRLQDLAGEFKVVNGEEKFVLSSAKMRAEKLLLALTKEGCGWGEKEPITAGSIRKLTKSARNKLCEEIDKLEAVESKKKDLPA